MRDVTHCGILLVLATMLVGTSVAADRPSAGPARLVTTQLTPEKELQKLKAEILKGFDTEVAAETPLTFAKRLPAELASKNNGTHVYGALMPELIPHDGLMPLDEVLTTLKDSRRFYRDALNQGRVADRQQALPWMHTTFFMVANKKALPYLPPNANLSNLSYAELIEWAERLKAQTGQPRFGLPLGDGGLLHRFIQGYALPSYTGSMVRGFRSDSAQGMWKDLKRLWSTASPAASKLDSLSPALLSGEVWVGFDHAARLHAAVSEKPEDFVFFPAPVGPAGRGFFYVLAGLAVPVNTPDKARSIALLTHLTDPGTQATTFKETGFFPVTDLPSRSGLNTAQRVVHIGAMAALGQSFSNRALVSAIPVTLGSLGGKFNGVYRTAFKRIVLNDEPAAKVLNELSTELNAVLKEAQTACWGLDLSRTTSKRTSSSCEVD
jgi:multiple sugar transport system substrate-binding protein